VGRCTCLDLNDAEEHEFSTDPLCPIHGKDGAAPAVPIPMRKPVVVDFDTPDRLYLVTVKGGIHPEVHGPFTDEAERQTEAERLHAAQDPETDAVFHAEVSGDRELRIDSYSAGAFESR
jgi:hypothetical protein